MTDFDFDELLEDLPDEVAQRVRDAASLILSGLDQARAELQMPYHAVTYKRMRELSERLAIETVDYSPYEGLLVGTWMAGSSRTQLLDRPA